MSSDKLSAVLEAEIPTDHSRQTSAEDYVRTLIQSTEIRADSLKVLDLGCGSGDSVELFRSLAPTVSWTGVDIEGSPEVMMRARTDAKFVTFDGIHLPFPDSEFDIIFSKQVFEHVRYPARLLAEVKRVLKPSGKFIGSTSHLEPYHSFSLHNHTPYGFKLLLQESGMKLIEVRPGIDGFTLLARRLLRRPRFFDIWWKTDSPFNRLLGCAGWLMKRSHREINGLKLLFCGHFAFVASREPTEPSK